MTREHLILKILYTLSHTPIYLAIFSLFATILSLISILQHVVYIELLERIIDGEYKGGLYI